MSLRTLTLILSAVILAAFLHTVTAAPTSSDINTILNAHNKVRAKHHAPALKWSTKLATYAQNWSNRCQFQHSSGPYGENLALGYPDWNSVVNGWYSEVKNYNYNNPGFASNTGHFTQVVWKATTEIGCGVKVCNNLGQGAKLYTCSYYVPGNMVGDNGKYFTQNVLRP
ncbi:hypothetical protein G6F70_005054 [Rhizopus microsporus]|uniref:SCP domain-containing protein n=2 Tax=Rhizopus TaxID=4842 RepID=A0A367K3Z0_RHIAZ|nr:hypothetical protein G6F71_004540 [Rhizopus microsporus]RCH96897.1 hypothetical protein CU097_008712 [Rhizopus azygosporus]KAG1199289.1 hypothetical protein G6F70_005054 [Rhizopus microsporus]KAG1211100.1 hypothetical protein G6F69_004885 [Rhizopus microsporus]KAG1229507.1 hypothetical protein G6F67_007099 [Rhizopus microsporus]